MTEPVRVAAARALEQVLAQGRTLDAALAEQLPRVSERDRGLLQALVYGSLRWLPYLEAQLRTLTPRADWRRDPTLRALLVLGAWEAQGLSTPTYAAVSEAVEAARRLRRGRAKGMVNAVLRRLHREAPPEPQADPARYALPEWLLERLREAWPADGSAVARASSEHPPMTLRVALDRLSRPEALERLRAAGIEAAEGAVSPAAVTLQTPMPVEQLPGFAEGWLAVQDEAAQLAAPLLDPRPGDRVLDACAAPGGKAIHLLEHQPRASVTALDRDADRLGQVRDNLRRHGRETACLAADAAQPQAWWDGAPYHRILLDAPCTGTGVLRRHPDIKWLREAADEHRMAQLQERLLEALWGVLAPGGRLVYATCSILPGENAAVVADFLERHPEARLGPAAPAGRPAGPGRQILPGEQGMDGFYYACLERA